MTGTKRNHVLKFLTGILCLGAPGVVWAQAFDLPDIPVCLELTPGAVAVTNTPVTVNLRIILDGVSRDQAAQGAAAAQSAYAPLSIGLSVSYDRASFASSEGSELIEEAKRFYGGRRPGGTHAVYVLTSKNLFSRGPGGVQDDNLVGLADCIGGIAYAEHAFAVGEAHADEPFLTLGANLAGKTLGHELGHLAGGHHHYANCVETVPDLGDAPCTLMINVVDLAALTFSTLNGLVVRGHAQLLPALPPAPSAGGDEGGSFGTTGLLLAIPWLLRRRSGRRQGNAALRPVGRQSFADAVNSSWWRTS